MKHWPTMATVVSLSGRIVQTAAASMHALETSSERWLRTLSALVETTRDAPTIDACLASAVRCLRSDASDVAFSLGYVVDADTSIARLVAHDGVAKNVLDAMEAAGARRWPFAEALATGRPASANVGACFPELALGGDAVRDVAGFVVPVWVGMGASGGAAFLVVGVVEGCAVDEACRSRYDLLSAVLARAATRVTSTEAERRHAAAVAEVDRAKMTFFSNVSHEFRTPLTLMLGPIEDELAERDSPLPPGRHARLETAHRNGLRLLRMVNTLLDFSHIEAGRMQAMFEPVDLAAITEDLAASFRVPIEKAGLRLSTRLEPLPEPVYVDREMWAKIVLNLLGNALKHTFKGGITLSLFASDESKDYVELRADDTGVGIPERELPRLFQRFHRVKGIRSRTDEGTGVGLALVRALATLHGGDVSVVSREGLGSSFRVRLRRGSEHLPRERVVGARPTVNDDAHVGAYVDEALQWSRDADGASEARNLDVLDADEVRAAGPRASVLLAENSADMRNYVGRLLARSFDVVAVADGEAALKAALTNPPDLIVLDVRLRGLDGFELLGQLRAAEATRSIPVILLSARAGEDAALEGLDAGADDYLVKPFSGKALIARVRSCIALAKMRKEAADKLMEANKELEAFSYSVSHDLRTPLRAIDGFSRVLQSEYADKLDAEGKRYVERIRTGAKRMGELIDDLLSLARITRAEVKRERTDLTAISRRILGDLAARDPERKVRIEIEEGMTAEADPRLVTVLFENLLGNAWKFTSKRPAATIAVASEERDGETVYLVRDDGAGFDMQYARKLFAPFQRLHAAAEFQGTGIGLATVFRIVTRHGGRLWADAAPDRGATFFFTLCAEES
ncbi:MAG TPA: ATP-binding protein [Polyangia bacterium]|nr:ATP-binding protein [Polyangia bacterium]